MIAAEARVTILDLSFIDAWLYFRQNYFLFRKYFKRMTLGNGIKYIFIQDQVLVIYWKFCLPILKSAKRGDITVTCIPDQISAPN